VTPDAIGGDDTALPDDTSSEDTTPLTPECFEDADCAATADRPLCDRDAAVCVPLPRGHQLGWRFGAADSVDITTIFTPPQPWEATDLEFHPERNELWVVNRRYEVDGICTSNNMDGARCGSLPGFVTLIFDPGTPEQRHQILEDGNSWHFMRRPPAMAMGALDTWATCAEASTGNFEDNAVLYVGPTLWSSDLAIFAQWPGPGLNGSHLDMLHASPWCSGIAHERDNVYWVFNGHIGSLDRYDFNEPHEPGGADHSDGEIFRYVEGQLSRVANVPGHMQYNHDDDHLYVVDPGNQRIVKLDALGGFYDGPFFPVYEPLQAYGQMAGVDLEEVVPAGRLEAPSGLVLHDGLLFVSDQATSRFHAFDLEGNEVRSLDTEFPPGTLAGMTMGRDDKIYFTDMLTGHVYRIDPK